jgi:hypothetical protein
MPQTSGDRGGQDFGDIIGTATERTRDPVREQEANLVRTREGGNQDVPNDRRHVVQYGSPGFTILPTRGNCHTEENRKHCSMRRDIISIRSNPGRGILLSITPSTHPRSVVLKRENPNRFRMI